METGDQERIAAAKSAQEFYLKYVGVLYDKTSAYTNIVLIGGYGAFFALLAATRWMIPARQLRWAAILMIISVSNFVAFEVVRMIITTKRLFTNWKAFREEEKTMDAVVINARFQALADKELRQACWLIPYWVITTLVAATTAIIAVAILLWNFVSGMF